MSYKAKQIEQKIQAKEQRYGRTIFCDECERSSKDKVVLKKVGKVYLCRECQNLRAEGMRI